MKAEFKNFLRIYDETLSEEQLDELFGVFRNNKKIETARQEFDKRKAQRNAAKDVLMKARGAETRRIDQGRVGDRFNPSSFTSRAADRAADKEWLEK